MSQFESVKNLVQYHDNILAHTKGRLSEIKREKVLAQAEIEALEKTKAIVFEVGEELHQIILGVFSEIGTTCLQAIFGEGYSYQMRGKISRGLLAVEHVVVDAEGNELNPLQATGGGLVDVLAFALRLSALILSDRERLLILDEPFRFLSRDKLPIIKEVRSVLSEQYNIQTLMITHLQELVSD